MSITMDKWVKNNLGKYIDYDKVYGVQCVDLIKHYVKNVLGIEPQSIGNAIEYYNKRKTSTYLTKNFTWHGNTPEFIPKKGDICVFTSKTGHGHVAVATGEGTTSYFYSYDQNYPSSKGEPMTKIKHSYNSFLGVLRPKNQKNINPKPVYKTTTANLHAYKSSNCKFVTITIPAGTKVELINANAGKFTQKGVTYTKAVIKYKKELYYVAKKYLK